MPQYNYQCFNCKYEFEHFQTMTSRKKKKCPECNEQTLVRLVGKGAGVIFKKGYGGFYSKDYGGKNASDGTTDR